MAKKKAAAAKNSVPVEDNPTEKTQVSKVEYITEESEDNTPEIKGVNVNGDAFKLDYNALKHRPVFKEYSVIGTVFENAAVAFTAQNIGGK